MGDPTHRLDLGAVIGACLALGFAAAVHLLRVESAHVTTLFLVSAAMLAMLAVTPSRWRHHLQAAGSIAAGATTIGPLPMAMALAVAGWFVAVARWRAPQRARLTAGAVGVLGAVGLRLLPLGDVPVKLSFNPGMATGKIDLWGLARSTNGSV